MLSSAAPEIRRAVEDLLLHADPDTGVLDSPAWISAGDSQEPPTLEITPGQLLGPYRIDLKIGAGGMGEVYRATDTRLNRSVAMKVSTVQFSKRFEGEAKAIAALNHPNICQIFDVGPNYIVMEFIDGQPVIARGQEKLPPEKVLRIAVQIASAMESAHSVGIIHRDLKPANILLTPAGTVKLLDFGLAKRSTDSSPEITLSQAATQVGMILGTPGYMSPEQAEGQPADARSDIFSFGAILYELLAGTRAFPGTSAASAMGAILHRDPDPLNPPSALSAIAFKCLAKPPADRFQTATELREALEQISNSASVAAPAIQPRKSHWLLVTVAIAVVAIAAIGLFLYRQRSAAGINSIAVLPLDMRSKEPDADYISDGIAESINNSLARLPGIQVVPNSVAQRYKGQAGDFQKIGASLNVQAILAGRVTQRAEDLAIAIELDDVRTGKQLWGQQYNRKVADLLMVQQDIAREVSQRLRSQQLSDADRQNLNKGSTSNPEAYQLFLKGLYFSSKFTKDGFDKGIVDLNQAIALDPQYARAYSILAWNYINQDDWFIDPKIAGPKARDLAQKAIQLDDSDAEAHAVLAIEKHWYDWDWAGAEREFKRAQELDPENGDAHGYYSWFLASQGRKDEAAAEARVFLKTDPLSSLGNGNLGSVSVFNHQWDQATEQLRSAIDLDPNFWFDYLFLGRAYEAKGKFPESIDAFKRGIALEENLELWGGLGHVYAVSGNRAEAQKVLDHLQELSTKRYVAPYNVAIIYAGLGDKDQAFEWLNRAYDDRSYILVVYLNTDSRLDNLRSDPRFQQLRQKINLPEPK